jgi:hypothetical protein
METMTVKHNWQKDLQLERFPALARMFERIDRKQLEMEIRPCEKGIEFRFKNEINGIPNRCWLRICFPTETKCLLFFHKKSSVPFSRDRFSYGGVVIDERSTSRFDDGDIEEWIQFLQNGLLPKTRPRSLKKSLPYTVPED